MKPVLRKHLPKDSSAEEFDQMWENSRYLLTPLYKHLAEEARVRAQVKEEDFDSPNHHAKWAFREGRRLAYEEIAALMPASCKD